MTRPRLRGLVAVWFALVAAAGIAGAVAGAAHGYAGLAASLLCVPAGFVTVWGTGRLARRTKFAGLIGMAAGMVLRTVVAVGGGAVLFFAVPAFREMTYGFWAWVVAAYLATLAAETAILARFFWVGSAVGRE